MAIWAVNQELVLCIICSHKVFCHVPSLSQVGGSSRWRLQTGSSRYVEVDAATGLPRRVRRAEPMASRNKFLSNFTHLHFAAQLCGILLAAEWIVSNSVRRPWDLSDYKPSHRSSIQCLQYSSRMFLFVTHPMIHGAHCLQSSPVTLFRRVVQVVWMDTIASGQASRVRTGA